MKKISQALALAAFLGMSLAATSQSQAQGYYPNHPNQYGHTGGYNHGYDPLYQNIYNLDNYGDQMSYHYSLEARNYRGCGHSAALLAEMQRYNGFTNNLIVAYNGSCPKAFRASCNNVSASYNRIQHLRSRARVSPTVCVYINQSYPMVNHINANYSYWQPRTAYAAPRPVVVNNGSCSPQRDRKFDLGSAIIGAVAGRIIHGVIHHH